MVRHAVVRDIDMGWDKITKDIRKLRNQVVLTGFQESQVTYLQVKNGRMKKAGQSIATIAAQNEFGAPGVPQRSFMRTAFDENIDRIYKFAQAQYGMVIDGVLPPRVALDSIGQVMVALIRRKITTIIYPPNSPLTIALKGSSKPLIDTGQMLNSVSYTVRKINA